MNSGTPLFDIRVNPCNFQKDPMGSDLGRRILSGTIEMVQELGFEHFTFKKLGQRIGSPEASIYRYFESKHQALLYLTSWFWTYQETRIAFGTANIDNPRERLLRALNILVDDVPETEAFPFLRLGALQQIIISESAKSYLVKEVDQANKEGAYLSYKNLVQRLSNLVLEIRPDYRFPHMLVTTLIEGIHSQRYFAAHLPRLTDSLPGMDSVKSFFNDLIVTSLKD